MSELKATESEGSDWRQKIKDLTKAIKDVHVVPEKRLLKAERDKIILAHHTEIITERSQKEREKAFRFLEERGMIINIPSKAVSIKKSGGDKG